MNNQRQQLMEALAQFKEAANKIDELWFQVDGSDLALSQAYPFEHSFDEQAALINGWVYTASRLIESQDYIKPYHEDRMHRARILAEYNNKLFCKLGESDMLLTFDTDEFGIYDPFHDETGRDKVDPVEYYGKAFLTSGFYLYDEELTKQSEEVDKSVNHSPRVQDYIDELKAFMNTLNTNAEEMLDSLEHKEYDEKYDIVISQNGSTIRIPLNADSHDSLLSLIQEEIDYTEQ